MLTVNGKSLTFDNLPTYTVNESSGTLGSGQQYIAKTPVSGPGYMGIIYLHGALSTTEAEVNTSPTIDAITDMLASYGFPVIAGRAAGSAWGNDASRTAIDELTNFLVSDLGADSFGRFGFVGTSMGAAVALSWASQNLNKTACIAGLAPLASIQDVYVNDYYSLGIKASIETAYGGAPGWAAAQPTHDPTPLAEAGAFDGLQFKAWYGSTDTIVLPSTVQHLVDEIGSTASMVPLPRDHFFVLDVVPAVSVVSYIIGKYPPTAMQRRILT